MSMGAAMALAIKFLIFEICEMGKYAAVALLIHQIIYWTTGISLLNELIKVTLKEVNK